MLVCLAGYAGQAGTALSPGGRSASTPGSSSVSDQQENSSSTPPKAPSSHEISREEALSIALDNAGVPDADAYNIKNESDKDHSILIYDIKFETDYGHLLPESRKSLTGFLPKYNPRPQKKLIY